MDDKKYVYDFESYFGKDALNDVHQEEETKNKIDALGDLFDELDDVQFEKNDNINLFDYENKNDLNIHDTLDDTKAIDSFVPTENLLNEYKDLIDEDNNLENLEEENPTLDKAETKKKGRVLTKKIPFSNGSLTKTFFDCSILCFTASAIGGGMLMYIINHI